MKKCQDIMLENPATCLAGDTAYIIAQRMQAENIDVILVLENDLKDKLVGILTDRDIALRVVGRSLNATITPVSSIMTHNVLVCHPLDDLDITLKTMLEREIRRIPVVDDEGELVGIIVQARIVKIQMAIQIEQDDSISGFQIREIAHGWGNFTDVMSDSLKRLIVLKQLQDSLDSQGGGLHLSAGQGS